MKIWKQNEGGRQEQDSASNNFSIMHGIGYLPIGDKIHRKRVCREFLSTYLHTFPTAMHIKKGMRIHGRLPNTVFFKLP